MSSSTCVLKNCGCPFCKTRPFWDYTVNWFGDNLAAVARYYSGDGVVYVSGFAVGAGTAGTYRLHGRVSLRVRSARVALASTPWRLVATGHVGLHTLGCRGWICGSQGIKDLAH